MKMHYTVSPIEIKCSHIIRNGCSHKLVYLTGKRVLVIGPRWTLLSAPIHFPMQPRLICTVTCRREYYIRTLVRPKYRDWVKSNSYLRCRCSRKLPLRIHRCSWNCTQSVPHPNKNRALQCTCNMRCHEKKFTMKIGHFESILSYKKRFWSISYARSECLTVSIYHPLVEPSDDALWSSFKCIAVGSEAKTKMSDKRQVACQTI